VKRFVIIILILLPGILYSNGTVLNNYFISNTLGLPRNMNVYLPEGYGDGTLEYPSIFFLIGENYNHPNYAPIFSVLDDLIKREMILPVILVIPDGSVPPYISSVYTNSDLYGHFEDFIAYDLVNFIDTNYRTIQDPKKRSIMGHSTGGYGAMKLALKHPDIFCGVASHSGELDLNLLVSLWANRVLTEYGNSPPYNYYPEAGTWSFYMTMLAGAFSPNLNDPPYYVDFPLDVNGDVDDVVLARWHNHNPATLAAQFDNNVNLSIYFDCGINDELYLYPMNRAFADSLDSLGMIYEFQSYFGNHFDQLSERFPVSLSFLNSVMTPLFANFIATPKSGHAPLTVEFPDLSSSFNMPILSWAWDFDGDGIVDSNEKNPSWTYEEPGTYSVQLEILSDSLSDTRIRQEYIKVFNGESAIHFNEIGGYVVCPGTESLNLMENLTVETWINPTGWGEIQNIGLGKIIDKKKYALYLVGTNNMLNDHSLILLLQHTNRTSFSITPVNSIELNKWQHIAATYNASTSEVKIYIDGVEQSLSYTTEPSGNLRDNSGDDLYIGNTSNLNNSFQGSLDELRIWKEVRNADQILSNMNRHPELPTTGLVACWEMNEGNGEVISDVSGLNNHGSIFQAEWVQGPPLSATEVEQKVQSNLPEEFSLLNNYPNPFNAQTTIHFRLPHPVHVNFDIFNINGEFVKSLISKVMDAGYQSIKWDGTDNNGQKMSSGMYIYKINADEFIDSKKMLLLK
jgi:PKD repeat protein